jgi:2-(1,2-epoxy-1,2-dihydrophenyl)acetyl-CoA isomerase
MSDAASSEALKMEYRQGVAVLRLNSPDTMNALRSEVVARLIDALEIASHNARAIVLTGTGRAFCSGANLRSEIDLDRPDYDAGAELARQFHPLMRKLRDSALPIVTAVNGAAAGFGAAMAFAGDIVIAARDAFFLQPFRNIGLVPDGGTASLLLASAGRARALEMMLLGERIPAQTALEWGLVNRIVEPEALDEEAFAMARRLAEGPTLALGMIRKLAWMAMDVDYDAMLDRERELQRSAGLTSDHREGVEAFLAKRQPHFTGA